MSTLNRKAWGDLTQHRARTLLAAFTLCIAIASLGFLAVPSLLNAAMDRQVQQSHLYDVGMPTRILNLTPAQLSALGRLPGITAVSADLGYVTTAASAAGTQNVQIAGGDLASATVDTVPLLSGRLPGRGEVLADAANGRATDYALRIGATIKLRAANGALVPLRVSGTGINLAATPGANGSSTPVFYTTLATLESLRGVHGINFLGFRLQDDTPAAQSRAIAEVRAYLTTQTGADPITGLPATRATGQWPGQAGFGRIDGAAVHHHGPRVRLGPVPHLGHDEHAHRRAGRRDRHPEDARRPAAADRRDHRAHGGDARRGRSHPWAPCSASPLPTWWRIPSPRRSSTCPSGSASLPASSLASLLAGPALAVAASLPALRRALRRPVAETLAGTDSGGGFGAGWLDRLVARSGLLAGAGAPSSLRMGVRNALRQKRRSLATIAQIAVAGGLAITFLALGQSASALISHTENELRFSAAVGMTSGSPPFGRQAVAIAAATPGITSAEPVETSAVQVPRADLRGLGPGPASAVRLPAERGPLVHRGARPLRAPTRPSRRSCSARCWPAPVHARIGRILTVDTPVGFTRVRVVGLDTGDTNGGSTIYFPLPVLERLDGGPGTADSIWLKTGRTSHAAINRAATAVGRRLTAAGYRVSTSGIYVVVADITASARAILAIVQILGLLVVAITLMGLVSALSMAVIERTREIGILRCVGARARQIRRVFTAEAVRAGPRRLGAGRAARLADVPGAARARPAQCGPQPAATISRRPSRSARWPACSCSPCWSSGCRCAGPAGSSPAWRCATSNAWLAPSRARVGRMRSGQGVRHDADGDLPRPRRAGHAGPPPGADHHRRAAARHAAGRAGPDDRGHRPADDRRRPARAVPSVLGGDRVPAGLDGVARRCGGSWATCTAASSSSRRRS